MRTSTESTTRYCRTNSSVRTAGSRGRPRTRSWAAQAAHSTGDSTTPATAASSTPGTVRARRAQRSRKPSASELFARDTEVLLVAGRAPAGGVDVEAGGGERVAVHAVLVGGVVGEEALHGLTGRLPGACNEGRKRQRPVVSHPAPPTTSCHDNPHEPRPEEYGRLRRPHHRPRRDPRRLRPQRA